MRKFLEEYWRAILTAIVVIIIIMMLTPIGASIKGALFGLIDDFGNTPNFQEKSEINYIVEYNSTTGARINTSVISGSEGMELEVNPIEINGYEKPQSQKITFTASEEKTITFEYKPIVYNLTLNYDGGVAGGPVPQTYTVENSDIVIKNPTKGSESFLGWIGSDLKNPTKNLVIKKGSYGDRTYTAKWESNKATITIKNQSTSGKDLGTETKEGIVGLQKEIIPEGKNGYTTPNSQTIVLGKTNSVTFKYTPINYEIKYEGIEGTQLNNAPTNYNIESKDIVLPTPSKNGAEFLGWTTSEGNTPSKNMIIPTGSVGNKTFIAKWKSTEHTVTFNTNGGISVQPITVSHGKPIVNLPKTTRNGYTFDGWFVGAEKIENNYIVNNNLTVNAKWTPISYDLKYNLNGGALSKENPKTYTIESNITLTNPTKLGYTFLGWTSEDIKTPTLNVIVSQMTGNKTFIANWQAKTGVTYKVVHNQQNLDLKTYKQVSEQSLSGSAGSTLTLSELKQAYTGFNYVNGKVDNKITETTTIKGDGSLVISLYYDRVKDFSHKVDFVDKNITTSTTVNGTYGDTITVTPPNKDGYESLGSQQIIIGSTNRVEVDYIPINYTITYHLNGGVATNKTSYNIETETFKLTNPTKTGYIFTGWTGTDISLSSKDVSIVKGSMGNREYTANYDPATNVKYVINHYWQNITDDNYTLQESENKVGTTNANIVIADTTKTPTGFDYANSKVNNVVSTNTTIKPDGTTVINNYYNRKMIRLDVNASKDGDSQIQPIGLISFDIKVNNNINTSLEDFNQNFKYGSTYEITNLHPKNGYIYKGLFGTSKPLKGTLTEENIIIFDIRTNSYTLNFDTQGGDTISSKSIKYGDKLGTLPTPTKVGYTFKGWYTAPVGGNVITSEITMPAKEMTIYAQWTSNSYILTYDANGGSVTPSSKNLNYGEAYGTLPTPTRSGYKFLGWYTQPSGGTQVSESTTIGAGNTTIYAHWKANQYTYNIVYESISGKSLGSSTQVGSFGQIVEVKPVIQNGYKTPAAQNVTFDSTTPKTIKFIYTPEEYIITYVLDGGAKVDNPIKYTVESKDITLINPTKTGHTFAGWSGTGLSQNSDNVIIKTGSTGNRTYTANWNLKYLCYNLQLLSPNGKDITPKNSSSVCGNYGASESNFLPQVEGYIAPKAYVEFDQDFDNDSNRPTKTFKYSYIEYSISYELNLGKWNGQTADIKYNIETPTFALKTPIRDGYKFTGWTGSNGNTPQTSVSITEGSTGNKNYTANWESNSVVNTINLKSSSGKILETKTITGNYGSSITYQVPDKTGYIKPSNPTIKFDNPNGKTIDITYQLINYGINYYLDGGTNDPTNPNDYNVETPTFTLKQPSKIGHRFSGWTGTGLDGKTASVTINKGSIGELNFTANWAIETYKLTIDAVQGHWEGSKGTSRHAWYLLRYNDLTSNISLSDPKLVPPEGYRKDKIMGIPERMPDHDCEGYITYLPKEYSINYILDGGINSLDNPTTYTIESSSITLQQPTKSGYEFLGWTGSNGNTPQKTVVIPKGSTGNRKYTANWKTIEAQKDFKIYYHSNIPGNDRIITEGVNKWDNITFKPANTFLHPEGKAFAHWAESPDGVGANYIPGTSLSYYWGQDLHLYAIWEKAENQFTVTLNSNPDYGTTEGSGKYAQGTTVQIKAIPKLGNEFVQWSDGVTLNPRNIVVNSNIELTAQFRRTSNPITYYQVNLSSSPSDGGYTDGSGTYQQGSTAQIKAIPYSGYEFVRWSDGNTSKIRNITVNSNINLTASFKKKATSQTYTVNVNPYPNYNFGDVAIDGFYTTQGQANYGQTIELTALAKSGYTFLGWKTDLNGGYVSTSSAYRPTIYGNTTYYAIFDYHTNHATRDLVSGPEVLNVLKGLESSTGKKITGVKFTDLALPSNGTLFTGLDKDNDNGVVSSYHDYNNGIFITISSGLRGRKIIADKDCNRMFENLQYIQFLELANLDTSNTTTMRGMFARTGHVASAFSMTGLNSLDVSNVYDFGQTFFAIGEYAPNFTLDVSSWVIKDGANMYKMFGGSKSLSRPHIGMNAIATPRYIPSNVQHGTEVTGFPWYDASDNYREYATGLFPLGITSSHVLLRERP